MIDYRDQADDLAEDHVVTQGKVARFGSAEKRVRLLRTGGVLRGRLRELERENRELRMQAEFLKKQP